MTKKKDPKDLKKPAPKKATPIRTGKPTMNKGPVETKATVSVEKGGPKPSPEQAKKEKGFRISLLDNWMKLNAETSKMSEEECFALIMHERETTCRPNFILRLYGRYSKLRGLRERTEFMARVKPSK